jgi:hypothetical protein
MHNDLLISFQAALGNFCVVVGVAMAVVGPVVGLLAKRFHDEALEQGSRFLAVGVLISLSATPAVMLGPLITNPHLSLNNHREQAELGLLVGFLVLAFGGIALAIESRYRQAKKKR